MRSEFCFERQDFKFTCLFRAAIRSDVAKLEWFGALAEHRQIIAEAFAAQTRGQGLVLVAAVDDFPVAQLWVRFPKGRPARFWAFRVMQPFQGLGLGSQLFRVGENVLTMRRFAACEVGVEKTNAAARRLYEKMGYRLCYEEVEEYSYVTPNGESRCGRADQLILKKKLKLGHADGEPSFAGKAAEEGRPEHTILLDASSNERA
jgi:ribosomal protein S18 acetylase RimI-like enzyme